eukprot:scaffold37464_cov505-Skeletonema_dohrnii-CCMP3373.AAC.1
MFHTRVQANSKAYSRRTLKRHSRMDSPESSFDELKEEERSLIYKCGRFPEWDEITEEPISVSI